MGHAWVLPRKSPHQRSHPIQLDGAGERPENRSHAVAQIRNQIKKPHPTTNKEKLQRTLVAKLGRAVLAVIRRSAACPKFEVKERQKTALTMP